MADELSIVKSEPLRIVGQSSTTKAPTEQFWAEHPNLKQLASGAVNTLPAVGAMAGGIAATPETLGVGSVAGAALGAGAGRGLRDLIAESVGLEPESTPLGKAARIALDTLMTAATPAALDTVKRMVTRPGATFADIIDVFAHPQKTLTDTAAMLRGTSAEPMLTRPPTVVSNFNQPTAMSPRLAAQKSPTIEQKLTEALNDVRVSETANTPAALVGGKTPPPTGATFRRPAVDPMRRGEYEATIPDKWGSFIYQMPNSPAKLNVTAADVVNIKGLMQRGMAEKDAVSAVLSNRSVTNEAINGLMARGMSLAEAVQTLVRSQRGVR